MEESEERKVKVVKLGEFKLNDYNVLVVNKTDYSGEDRVDFRVWTNTAKYKGPTKQGFVLTMGKVDDFINFVSNLKEKLSVVRTPVEKKKKSKRLQ